MTESKLHQWLSQTPWPNFSEKLDQKLTLCPHVLGHNHANLCDWKDLLMYHILKVLLILQNKENYIYVDVINNDDYL